LALDAAALAMRHLFYTNYQSGQAGLSNAIMSIEIGVVLAHLTNRFLVLDGNRPPPANLVAYDGRVHNDRPSRVTDLIDIPVPWGEPESIELERPLDSLELTDRSLSDLAFYFPQTLDLASEDARSFARGRDHWVTITEELDRIPVLRLSEEPLVPPQPPRQHHRNNLGFYSYQFYLNDETRRSVYRLLGRMRAKEAFAELAKRVAGDIGSFNAVHMRRGDFKVTYGVTTLDRQSWEAVEALDQVFDRKDPLVIVTDEREDPFFREITLAYPHHFFIDWHILDAYETEFAQLPQTDSLSLAYLSQLVAAESTSFMGTMTSTFTSIIQRYRGNSGKDEPFRFLWNELPEPDAPIARGRHAVSHCVALDRGVMVEEREGPYSWNRVSQRINPAWMREWPESFLTQPTLTTGILPRPSAAPTPSVRTDALDARRGAASLQAASVVYLTFENLQIAIRSADADILYGAGPSFGARPGEPAGNVIADLEVISRGDRAAVLRDGQCLGEAGDAAQLGELVKTLAVPVFTNARRQHSWLRGAGFARAGRAMVVAGDLGGADDSVVEALQAEGWELLERGVIAIRIHDRVVLPFGASTRPEGAAGGRRIQTPLAGLVVATQRLDARDLIAPLSPAVAVVTLIETSLDYRTDPDRAVERLCRLVEQQPVAQLSFSRAKQAARLLSRWADPSTGVAS
jgi:hypothetical protein